jgi:hypothetical protein
MFCVPTMLCAISGKSGTEIGLLLQQAAKDLRIDIPAELQEGYDINVWLRAIKIMGGNWAERDDFSDWERQTRPSMHEWMRSSANTKRWEVAFADGTDPVSRTFIGHTFATLSGDIVDTYTKGRRETFEEVATSHQFLRIKRSFVVT